MPHRIVLADDDDDLRRLLRIRLVRSGFEVIEASDGQEALDRVREHRPDLVILDHLMPRKNGAETCREIKANVDAQALPVILVTASPEIAWAEQGPGLGADRMLVKPFEFADLLSTIGGLLHGGTGDVEASARH